MSGYTIAILCVTRESLLPAGIYLLAFFLVPFLLLAFCTWALDASCSVSCIISGLLMYLVTRNRQISGFA